MMKKRIASIILSTIVTFGVMLFSNNFRNSNSLSEVHAEELVGNPSVSWNNLDYSGNLNFTPHLNEQRIPQQGYCLLVEYEKNIASDTHCSKNLLNDNVEGCNVGDYILINGKASKSVDNVIIYCYPLNGFYIYVPLSSVELSDEYEYLTINVLEGMSIDGAAHTIATRFEYRGLPRSFNKWEINPEPIEKVEGEFSGIGWNNRDYSFQPLTLDGEAREAWSGELGPNGAPTEGYTVLAFFNEPGKTYDKSVIGDQITGGRGVLGLGLNVDYKVKVNGVNIVEVPGSICNIYPAYGLFFYVPDTSLTNKDIYPNPTIEIENGLHFNHVYLPSVKLIFRGELGQLDCWTYRLDDSCYNKYAYNGVAGGWNNTPADSAHTQTILCFGEYGVDYLKNTKVADGVNLVKRYTDCGNKITINGVPLWKIDDTVVSYGHGYNYVYMVLPVSVLQPSNGYKVVTLHIEKDTIFHDTLLDEVTLYLYKDQWVMERPNAPTDDDYDTAISFSSLFDEEIVTMTESNNVISTTKEYSIDCFGLLLDYKIISKNSAFVMYLLGNNDNNGLRVVFVDNSISIYDATQNNALLGSAKLEPFECDEWYTLLITSKMVDNKLSILVAVDYITYIKVDNTIINNKDNVGKMFSINLGSGSASFKNANLDNDNKKPILTYTGKSIYSVLSGSEVIDFVNKCGAYDLVDGNLNGFIEVSWPEESITNNKINKGTWVVVISVCDHSGNTAKQEVIVFAADKLDVTVTFDGENPVEYKVGDHIAPVTPVIPEGDESTSYRFIGWYYNGILWDFENDYIVSDMNLVSKFQETAIEHIVSFFVEGLDNLSSYTLYFKHGTKLDMQTFAKEGYTLKAYVDEEEVESIVVTKNMSVKLVYSNNNPPTKRGCGGEIVSTTILIPSICTLGIVILSIMKKRGGKEHE